jgi:single-stranded DNA-specific DHH superfamily exonuclease
MPAAASVERRSGVDLLLNEDEVETARLATELDRLNRERQAIEIETVAANRW